jgi:hypothetical protein
VIDVARKEEGETLQKSKPKEKPDLKKAVVKPEDKLMKLELQVDIYSYTYLKIHNDDNPFVHGDLMIKCFLTIVLQMMIMFLRFKEAINSQG